MDRVLLYVFSLLVCLATAPAEASDPWPEPIEILADRGFVTSDSALVDIALDSGSSSEVRALAIHAFSESGSESAADVIITLLGDPDTEVRASAASALGRLKDERAVPHLIDFLESAQAPIGYHVAIYSLTAIGERQAIAAVTRIATDLQRQQDHRLVALRALGDLISSRQIDPQMVVPKLLPVLDDSDSAIRAAAAHALAEHGGVAATKALVDAAGDKSVPIKFRRFAILDLERMSGQKYIFSPFLTDPTTDAQGALQLENWWALEQTKESHEEASDEIVNAAIRNEYLYPHETPEGKTAATVEPNDVPH